MAKQRSRKKILKRKSEGRVKRRPREKWERGNKSKYVVKWDSHKKQQTKIPKSIEKQSPRENQGKD